MKTYKKIVCLLLSILMLAITAQTSFAESTCDHKDMYEIKLYPNGNDEEYFRIRDNTFTNDGITQSHVFYYCPSCNSFKYVVYQSNGYVSEPSWLAEELFSVPIEYYLKFNWGIYAPGSCLHNNCIAVALAPTCKSIYLDFVASCKIFNPSITDEEIKERINSYGKPVIVEETGEQSITHVCYCNDCNKAIHNSRRFDAKGNCLQTENYTMQELALIILGQKSADDLINSINACFKPAEPHTYKDKKCIYCGLAEPEEPADPSEPVNDPTVPSTEPAAQPEKPGEPAKKSVLDDVINFIKKLGSWLKSLFSFEFLKNLF